jgi:hypothetical protein
MQKVALSILVLAGLSSTSVMAQDAFSYVKGSATWAHTKSDYVGGKDSKYTSRNSGNDSMAITNLGMGVFTPLSSGLNLYGEAGLMGYSMERELAADVNDSGWDNITRKESGSLYGEVGLRYDLGVMELSTGYRYANMTDDMHDFKVGAAYKVSQNLALTADYTYRKWDLQQGSISSVGVKYSF